MDWSKKLLLVLRIRPRPRSYPLKLNQAAELQEIVNEAETRRRFTWDIFMTHPISYDELVIIKEAYFDQSKELEVIRDGVVNRTYLLDLPFNAKKIEVLTFLRLAQMNETRARDASARVVQSKEFREAQFEQERRERENREKQEKQEQQERENRERERWRKEQEARDKVIHYNVNNIGPFSGSRDIRMPQAILNNFQNNTPTSERGVADEASLTNVHVEPTPRNDSEPKVTHLGITLDVSLPKLSIAPFRLETIKDKKQSAL